MTEPAAPNRAPSEPITEDLLIGVDVGGTTMSAGLVTADGRVLHYRRQPTHRPEGGGALERLQDLAAEMAAEAHRRGRRVA